MLAFRPVASLTCLASLLVARFLGSVVGASWVAPRGRCRAADTARGNAGEEKGLVPGRRGPGAGLWVTISFGDGSLPTAAAAAVPARPEEQRRSGFT